MNLQDIHNYRLAIDQECDDLLRAKVHALRLKGVSYEWMAEKTGCVLATITMFAKGKRGLQAKQRGELIRYIARVEANKGK